MPRIHFTKMHGLGNDFVVLDATGTRWPAFVPTAAQARWLADRRFGVGCDQILVVEPAPSANADFRYRIFNADGGEVEQCGNGARCFVRYVHEAGLSAKTAIRVETLGGLIEPRLEADGLISVDMGVPRFAPADIPFAADGDALLHKLYVDATAVEISVVSMGNPHAVQVDVDVDAAPVTTQGPAIERHERFPQRVNAGYMQVVDRHAIRLRVWERGTGETPACGTGACAAVVAGIRRGLLETPVRVATRGGELVIDWPGPGHAVRMTGPAVSVFSADIDIPEDLA